MTEYLNQSKGYNLKIDVRNSTQNRVYYYLDGTLRNYADVSNTLDDYNAIKTFLAIYPSDYFDYAYHGFPTTPVTGGIVDIPSDYYDLQAIYDENLGFSSLGTMLTSTINNIPLGSFIKSKQVDYNSVLQHNDTFTMHEFDNFFICEDKFEDKDIYTNQVVSTTFYYSYKMKNKLPTTCCITVCCNPNDYILIS